MELQALISTMNQQDYELINEMNIDTNAIVINQGDRKSVDKFNSNNSKITWINSKSRGLSKSRNIALRNATSAVCLLADDDLKYIKGYKDIILEQFKLYPNADIITFQVEGIENKFKDYYNKPRNLNYLTSMKVSSVEIAFKVDSIRKKDICFNELFGSGAKYISGEESLFLIDSLKSGLKLQYVPIKIADLHLGESSWFKGYNKDYFSTKGAVFAAMSEIFSIPLIIQFALRKHKLFSREMTRSQAIKIMLKGRREFLKGNNKYCR